MNDLTQWAQRGWANVLQYGLMTAVVGLLIVFAALALITLFISLLPHILHAIHPLPEDDEVSPAARGRTASAEDELVAAIAFALHTELQRKGP
jgi:Na+-transporting methylmalonyl-CoA/oxaloacetate decarboxylase gamma subunit